jgi:hypothetical protein
VRWLVDECVAVRLVSSLRAVGHDVIYVAEAAAGLSDTDVIALAMREIGFCSPRTRISGTWFFAAGSQFPAWR